MNRSKLTKAESNEFKPAKKALGQNFLHDQNIIQRIVSSFNPKSEDVVVEIGPGRGALTDLLLQSQCQLHLIEFDYALAEYWQSKTSQNSRLLVHQGNVLDVDFIDLAKVKPLRVIGNLPYNISSQILIKLLVNIAVVTDVVAMLQLEMVDRICAEPNNKTYGRLSVMLQQGFDCEKLFKVPSGAFNPAPKIDSAIVQLTPHSRADLSVDDSQHFATIVKAAFAQRRKTLRNNLKGLVSAEKMLELDINPAHRAENLSVQDFVRIANKS